MRQTAALLIFLSLVSSSYARDSKKPSIRAVQVLTEAPKAYQPLELSLNIQAVFSNPFDEDDVTVTATFLSPLGVKHVVHGFWFQDFSRKLSGSKETLNEAGHPHWRVRYFPRESGTYHYRLMVRDRHGSYETAEYSLEVNKNQDQKGFIRVSSTNKRYFQFEDGSSYFPIGQNLAWTQDLGQKLQLGTFAFDRWLKRMGQAGANYARLWLGPFNELALERAPSLGRIDLKSAWRIDRILGQAEKNQIYLMLCFESFNALRSLPPYQYWSHNPYNIWRGGVLWKPKDFFTHKKAKDAFKQRLRYIVSRYSSSPHVFAWEFWNEVDLVEGYERTSVREWHQEMAQYLHETDPYQHLMTTSFSNGDSEAEIQGLPELSFIQTHHYGAKDEAEELSKIAKENHQKYTKPHFVGEFGIDWVFKGGKTSLDQDGLHLHNALWSSIFTLSAGTAMTWWWDLYIDDLDLYHHFLPVSRFVRDIPWSKAVWSTFEVQVSDTDLRVLGIKNESGDAYLWVQHKKNTWYSRIIEKNDVSLVSSQTITLQMSHVGTYDIEFWNTSRGEVMHRIQLTTTSGFLGLSLPPLETDIALKIRRTTGVN